MRFSQFAKSSKESQDDTREIWSSSKMEQLNAALEQGYELKTPFYDNDPKYRKSNVVFEYTAFEMEELKRCARDIVYFANNYCQVMTDEGYTRVVLRPYQEQVLKSYQRNRFNIYLAARQVGKSLHDDSAVWTEGGRRRIGDLEVGDRVYGPDGRLTNVLGVFPQGERDVYEVTFSDGSTVRCCEEHLWTVQDVRGKERTAELRELVSYGILTNRGDYKWFVKTTEPVQFPHAELPMDPYTLGLFLGDGHIGETYTSLAATEAEIVDHLVEVAEAFDVAPYDRSMGGRSNDYVFPKRTNPRDNTPNKLRECFKELGLHGHNSYDKFIPEQYLYASVEQRVAVLQGLLDTDGHVTKKSNIEFSTCSSRLADDVQQLCESLGMVVRRSIKDTFYLKPTGERVDCRPAYRLKIQRPNGFPHPLFRLSRKQALVRDKHYDWGNKRGIVKVEKVGRDHTTCIAVDNETHLFLTDHFIPTHNTVMSCIFLVWFMVFHFDKNVLLCSNKLETSVEIMSKIYAVFEGLPFFMKPGVLDKAKTSARFDNGCTIHAQATTPRAGIGFTIHLLFLDEFAHVAKNIKEQFYTNIYPTLSSSKISRIIITSTPNGPELFKSLYENSKNLHDGPGSNEYISIKTDWYDVPGRDDAWKAREVAQLGSEEAFNAQYGCSFITSSTLLLSSKELAKLKESSRGYVCREFEAMEALGMDYSGLRWDPAFDEEELRDPTKQFVVSVDLAEGVGRDYTVFSIFRADLLQEADRSRVASPANLSEFFSLRQVGVFRSNVMSVPDSAKILYALTVNMMVQENVRIMLEANMYANELMLALLSMYPDSNDFDEETVVKFHHRAESPHRRPGFKWQTESKKLYCEKTKRMLGTGQIALSDSRTALEFETFSRNANGTYSAQAGNDDAAMAVVGVARFFDSLAFVEVAEEMFDTVDPTVLKALEAAVDEHDREFGGRPSAPKRRSELGDDMEVDPWSDGQLSQEDADFLDMV